MARIPQSEPLDCFSTSIITMRRSELGTWSMLAIHSFLEQSFVQTVIHADNTTLTTNCGCTTPVVVSDMYVFTRVDLKSTHLLQCGGRLECMYMYTYGMSWFMFCPFQRSMQLRDMLYAILQMLYTRKMLRLCSAFDRLRKNLSIHKIVQIITPTLHC